MSQTLIFGSKVVTCDDAMRIIEDGAILVSDSKIVEVGTYDDLKTKYPAANIVGGEDKWIIPGFVNAHYHCQAMYQLRNGIVEAPLEPWLLRCYSSKIGCNTPEIKYLEAAYACITLIKAGVTSAIDMYYGNDDPRDLGAQDALQAYIDAGIRVNFSPIARDEDTSYVYAWDEDFLNFLPAKLADEMRRCGDFGLHPVDGKIYVQAWENLYKEYNGHNGRVRLMLSPDSAQWVKPELLQTIKKMAEKYQTNIQTHCLETKYQLFYAQHHWGKSIPQYFHDLGFLGPEVSFGHGIWLTAQDIELCAKTGTSVSHNPGANLRLYSGIAPIKDYLAGGMNLGLGTDNLSFDNENGYLNDLRLAFLLHRTPGIPPVGVPAETLFKMATKGGARVLGLHNQVGSLEAGKQADITIIDTKRLLSPFMHPSVAPYDILLHRGQSADVHTVMVNGQILMENRQLTTINEEEIIEKYRYYGEKAWADDDRDPAILDELEKYTHQFYTQQAFDIPVNYQYNTK